MENTRRQGVWMHGLVMAGLVPAIHVLALGKAWMPGTRLSAGPGMTAGKVDEPHFTAFSRIPDRIRHG
jgi:hypothetical protein